MNYVEYAALIRKRTGTNATTLPDADIIVFTNPHLSVLAQKIAEANEDVFGMPMNQDLVAGQREYALPSTVVKIKRVEAILDGTNQKVYDEIDLLDFDGATAESDITSEFADQYRFLIFRNSLWLMTGTAIIDVTDGLILWAIVFPANFAVVDLADSTDMGEPRSATENGLPRQFHNFLVNDVVIDYKESQDVPIPLSQSELNHKEDLKEALNALRGMNLDRQTVPTMPLDDGSNY